VRFWPGLLLLAACAADPDPEPVARAAPAGDVGLVCGAPATATDHADAVPDCDATIGGVPLGRGQLLAAARLDRARLVLLTTDRALVVSDGGADERVIARDVADPRVATDGTRRVVFTQLPPGAEIAPDTTGTLVVLDLDRGTRRTVTSHPLDSSPFIVPGSDDVLFVSARTGLASLYVASPGRPARQLTNVGKRAVDADFVPVPGRELTWIPGTRVAQFIATYDGVRTTWQIDVDTGRAARVEDAP
jgi:hypothetical protein